MKFKNLFKISRVILFGAILALFFTNLNFSKASQAKPNTENYIVRLKPGKSLPRGLKSLGTQLTATEKFNEEGAIFKFSSNYVNKLISNKNLFQYIQQESVIKTESLYLSDPGFTTNKTDIDKQWALVSAGFLNAWGKATGTQDTIIAVIDTGIDVTHVDLQSINFLPGYNFLTNQPIPSDQNSDDNGHGTLVTGVIGAVPNNFTGIVGANWQVSILPIKALDSAGNGVSSSVSQGIIWATDRGAHVINLSLGGAGAEPDSLMADAISYAYSKGVIIIAAAGNDSSANGLNLDITPGYPVCQDNGSNMVIGVTAIDFKDQKPPFANYGSHCIDVSAPGKRILSTINRDPVSGRVSPNSYAYASGTSMAVPFVSAEAALIRAINPKATIQQIREVILKSVINIDDQNSFLCGGLSCTGLIGSGKIDAFKAVNTPIFASSILDQDLVLEEETGYIYYLNGGKRQPVSEFVRKQRFPSRVLKRVKASELLSIPIGPQTTPSVGTLVKKSNESTVYYITKGGKSPITKFVFESHNYNYSEIRTVPELELDSWFTEKFLAPKDGTLIRGYKGLTVYWVVSGELHPINNNFYQSRGLNVFPILLIPDQDIPSFQISSPYVL